MELETLTPRADSNGTFRVAYDGRVLGDSRGFGSEALCWAEIDRILEKDARDAVRFDRPLLYVRGA